MNSQVKIFEINISNYSYDDLLNTIERKIINKEKFICSYINVFLLQKSSKDTSFRALLNSFDQLYCDGVGVYIASKILHGKNGLKYRITGTDLFFKVLTLADKNKLRCFFYGGSEKAIELIKKNFLLNYPNIKITGTVSRDSEFKPEDIEEINKSESDILFIGLGTPQQEQWVTNYSKKINIPVQLTTGSGIDFMSGYKKRAPVIMQKSGFEWLFRLLSEPKRLWKRYLIGNPFFIFQILLIKLKLLIKEKN